MFVGGAVPGTAPVSELSPAQIAQAVGMVQEPFLKHFLVQPRPIEAHFHREFDVVDEGIVGGSGHHAVRVVPLIQDKPLKHGLAVNLDPFCRRC